MEQEAPKHELAVIYLKNSPYDHMRSALETDRGVVRRWLNDNSPAKGWDLVARPIYQSKPFKESMDEILETVSGHKYFVLITEIGCHAIKYLYDELVAKAGNVAHVTLLSVYDKVNLQPAVLIPGPAITLSLNAIRRCMMEYQLQELTKDLAHIKRLLNGVIQLTYAEQVFVEVERRPESLDEKFNTLMCGGLSNLTPYWNIETIEVDPVPVKPRPDADKAMIETCEE